MPSPLSVVIVNYNTCDFLKKCLASLLKSEGVELEIIVVDNASDDESGAMVKEHFPEVQLIKLPENQWFSGGNNVGISAASHETILLLNPDTVVESNTVSTMVQFLDNHPNYRGVTAQLRYPDGTIQPTCARIPTFEYLFVNYTIVGEIFRGWRDRLRETFRYGNWDRMSDGDVEAIPGSCTMMRRDDIWLDENLLLYFPEEDLARRTGGAFRFLAHAKIEHYEKSVTQNWQSTLIFYRDLHTYTRKHHGIFAATLIWIFSRPLLWGMGIKRLFTAS